MDFLSKTPVEIPGLKAGLENAHAQVWKMEIDLVADTAKVSIGYWDGKDSAEQKTEPLFEDRLRPDLPRLEDGTMQALPVQIGETKSAEPSRPPVRVDTFMVNGVADLLNPKAIAALVMQVNQDLEPAK